MQKLNRISTSEVKKRSPRLNELRFYLSFVPTSFITNHQIRSNRSSLYIDGISVRKNPFSYCRNCQHTRESISSGFQHIQDKVLVIPSCVTFYSHDISHSLPSPLNRY